METIALDGTKVHANASRHSALSYKRSGEIEVQLKAEIAQLLKRADVQESRAPLDIPAELARREARLEAIAQAKVEIERRSAERHAQAPQQYKAKLAQRKGKRPGGRLPVPPSGGVRPPDQVNLTDPESRIMPRSGGGGFEQSYKRNAVGLAVRGVVRAEVARVGQHGFRHAQLVG